MDPQSNQSNGLNVPPQAQASPVPAPATPVPAQAPPLPTLASGAGALPSPALPATAPVQPSVKQAEHGLPAVAADTDVIEKVWVDQAKQAVASTRNDPYKQVQALNRIKVEYMKKRYNKDIKLVDQ